MADYLGSCLCGAVKFEVQGEFDSFYLCHCQRCQKDIGLADGLAMNMKPEERDGFRQMMKTFVNIDVINEASIDSMVKHFTVNELSALADFYELSVAKSSMLKMGVYMAEIMPVIQAEMLRAAGEAQLAQAALNRQMPDKKITTTEDQ